MCIRDRVWRDVDLEAGVGLYLIIVLGERTDWDIVGEDDDAVVVGADADLVLGANHAVGGDASELGGLDGERLVAIVENSSYRGHDDLLASGDIGGAADDVERLLGTYIDSRNVEVVGIGVRLAREYLTDDEAFEAALDALGLLNGIDLKPDGCEEGRESVGRHVDVDVLLEPII